MLHLCPPAFNPPLMSPLCLAVFNSLPIPDFKGRGKTTCHPDAAEGQQQGNRERREEKDHWETAVREKME